MVWIGCLRSLQRAALAATLLTALAAGQAARAQSTDAPATTTAPATPQPASPAPSAPAPATPAVPDQTVTAPAAPARPNAAAPTDASKPDTTGASPGDTSISQTIDVQGRPAAVISGSGNWDSGFKTLTDAFAALNGAIASNGLASAGHPLAVFTATDDAGFKYSAMIPIAKAPDGKTELTPEIKIGETPSGKAIRFQHRASYDDIDSTYEAITAYLDEKGLESRNLFAEEYLNLTKTQDDPALEVDIYVYLK